MPQTGATKTQKIWVGFQEAAASLYTINWYSIIRTPYYRALTVFVQVIEHDNFDHAFDHAYSVDRTLGNLSRTPNDYGLRSCYGQRIDIGIYLRSK